MTLTRFSTLVAAAVLAPTVVASASTVRFETTLGDVDIDLFDDVAPLTVAQFTGIVENGDFDGTVFHRSVPGFVVQGGGFVVTGDPSVDGGDAFSPAPEVEAVENEPGVSNTRGTIALARVGGLPDSGTNQFFFNLDDSNSFLDDVDGGFTVFGELADDESQSVVDAIAALTVFATDPGLASAFNEVPATGTAPGSDLPGADQLVFITTASVLPDDVVTVDPTTPEVDPIAPVDPITPVDPVAPVDPVDPGDAGTPAAVPSPSALAAGLLGLGAMVARRRRRA